ncbi:MAG: dihydrofolate reductase, partial [Planctomycetota bacterium]|nr:dihydrofolate reductase [Planctomycetota bacterium]
MAQNRVIGRANGLPWKLSGDLKRFKSITMGHHIVMGRKTYESIGRLLPGRTTVIVSRQEGYGVEGAVVVSSLEEAIALSDDLFVIGGGQIYAQALSLAERIYLTRVAAEVEGDTYFPEVDWSGWRRVDEESHSADEKNDHACT